ncbi:MAG TPA: hypothetical protein VHX65_19855 [Pirellulales bacterium]|jgi:hypothetical protein|nr:hypothetical protein [Pirellulales bacterium]
MTKLVRKKSGGDFDTPQARIRLETGHWYPRVRQGEPPLSDDELRELWEAIGPELKSGKYAKLHPGQPLWAAWAFDLLPADARRRTTGDDGMPETSAEPPSEYHHCDGYETADEYFIRRGLNRAHGDR